MLSQKQADIFILLDGWLDLEELLGLDEGRDTYVFFIKS